MGSFQLPPIGIQPFVQVGQSLCAILNVRIKKPSNDKLRMVNIIQMIPMSFPLSEISGIVFGNLPLAPNIMQPLFILWLCQVQWGMRKKKLCALNLFGLIRGFALNTIILPAAILFTMLRLKKSIRILFIIREKVEGRSFLQPIKWLRHSSTPSILLKIGIFMCFTFPTVIIGLVKIPSSALIF